MSAFSAIKVPLFDRRQLYDAQRFKNNEMQKYIALFLSKPELYHGIHLLNENEKQDYFFDKFHKFASKYIQLDIEKDFDTIAYFRSLQMDRAGSANVCGGGGAGRSNSGRKYLLDKYKSSQEVTKKMSDYLKEKYGIQTNGPDHRLFLGHTEPWKNASPELLTKESWEWVISSSYEDETYNTKLPLQLDKSLIPLSIRNKTIQKWTKDKNDKVVCYVMTTEEEDDKENIVFEEDKVNIIMTDDLLNLINDEEW